MIDYAIGLARRRNSDHSESVVERPIHFEAADFAGALYQVEDGRRRPAAALEHGAGFVGITRGTFSSTPPPVMLASPFTLNLSNISTMARA